MVALVNEESKGLFAIVPTPFHDDGRLDLESTDRLVDFYLDEGVDGLTILGIMGEANKLSSEEQGIFLKRFLSRVNGRVPTIVGVSNPGLDNLAATAREAMACGAGGVMVAGTPNLKTDDQVYRYFTLVAEKLGPDVPICLQDYPQATGVHLSVSVINRLIADCPSIVTFKHEDCPGHAKLSALRRASDEGLVRRISILVGNGGLYVPQELRRGADGIMTGFAFPGMLAEVFRLFSSCKVEEAEDLFDLYLPVLRHEQQIGFGLALRKETLHRRGVLSSAKARDPGPKMNAQDHKELDELLARLIAKLKAAGVAIPSGF